MAAAALLPCLAGAAVAQAAGAAGAGIAMHEYGSRLGRTMAASHEESFAVAAVECERVAALQPEGLWTFLDLGTANGLGTLPLVEECVQRVRKVSSRPIAVVFEDGPWNDFSALLRLDAQATYGEGVYPLVSSIHFFRATVPPGSVHLAFSSAAMHYLSGPPPRAIKEGGLHHTDAAAEEQAAFARQAALDWETLLLARAAELAPGGRLVVQNFAVDERGYYLGSTDYGASIYTELSRCLREMVADGALERSEFEAATSPEYFRTLHEHMAPFDDAGGRVRRAGLELVSSEVRIQRCVLRRDYADGRYESAAEYGAAFAKAVSAFTWAKVMRAFEGSNRTAREQGNLADEVFERFAGKVAARPLAFGIDNVMALLVVEKRPVGESPAAARDEL